MTSKWQQIGDLGCGKLRHFSILSPLAKQLVLIDTAAQLSATHRDDSTTYTIVEVALEASQKGKLTSTNCFEEFAVSRLNLDLIVCVAVLDVVPRSTRRAILSSAARNLARSGLFVVIVPRNDSTILRRCAAVNKYQDGHTFAHHGVRTFFHNFRDHRPIIKDCTTSGLTLLKDLSRYRQVSLIFGNSLP
jgi:SAM-dependent methyltransferase